MQWHFGRLIRARQRHYFAPVQSLGKLRALPQDLKFLRIADPTGASRPHHGLITIQRFGAFLTAQPRNPRPKNSWIIRVQFVRALEIVHRSLVHGSALRHSPQPPPSQREARVPLHGGLELSVSFRKFSPPEPDFPCELMRRGGLGRIA